ncbi:hypothetical protein [Micromonospora phytophila]|uniref:hypothetical protein n=1 Tax=Micromonospora phytophila TaxID=709888 RepID=UPI003556F3AE
MVWHFGQCDEDCGRRVAEASASPSTADRSTQERPADPPAERSSVVDVGPATGRRDGR